MYRTEILYFEYVILGLPGKCFPFLVKFKLKGKPTPTVYTSKSHAFASFFRLAFFCLIPKNHVDAVLTEALTRHAIARDGKKHVLLYTDEFEEFISRNLETLEKFYLIERAEDN